MIFWNHNEFPTWVKILETGSKPWVYFIIIAVTWDLRLFQETKYLRYIFLFIKKILQSTYILLIT